MGARGESQERSATSSSLLLPSPSPSLPLPLRPGATFSRTKFIFLVSRDVSAKIPNEGRNLWVAKRPSSADSPSPFLLFPPFSPNGHLLPFLQTSLLGNDSPWTSLHTHQRIPRERCDSSNSSLYFPSSSALLSPPPRHSPSPISAPRTTSSLRATLKRPSLDTETMETKKRTLIKE